MRVEKGDLWWSWILTFVLICVFNLSREALRPVGMLFCVPLSIWS